MENLDFYINEIDLDGIDFLIYNNNTDDYYNLIDKVAKKINGKD